jgi:DNA-binding transcriptional regulator LsrR (DeoR family)
MRQRAITIFLLVAFLSACASTPEVQRYRTIASINLTVQTAVSTFGGIYQAKKAEDPVLWGQRYDQAQKAYENYQVVAEVARQTAQKGGETADILAVVQTACDGVLKTLAEFGVQ